MPYFPVINDKSKLEYKQVILTQPLLGFYVNKAPLSRVEGYTEGLRDTYDLINDALIESFNQENLTLDDFRCQLNGMLSDRLELRENMDDFISKARLTRQENSKPQ